MNKNDLGNSVLDVLDGVPAKDAEDTLYHVMAAIYECEYKFNESDAASRAVSFKFNGYLYEFTVNAIKTKGD